MGGHGRCKPPAEWCTPRTLVGSTIVVCIFSSIITACWSFMEERPCCLPAGSSYDLYPRILQHVPITIYNGDVDACVPYNRCDECPTKYERIALALGINLAELFTSVVFICLSLRASLEIHVCVLYTILRVELICDCSADYCVLRDEQQ